jgi:predicted CXXCH cytochrome family protein
MRRWLEDKEHLARMGGLFVIGIAAFVVLQVTLVPAGFGRYGHYRAGALDDNAGRPLRFAGRAACEECHTDVVAARKGGRHERVGCEACHWAQADHAASPGERKLARPDSRAVCLKCHVANVAKPAGFPQVVVAEHSESGACIECHKPHSPAIK